ncbi:MAG: hypothetical protein JW841_07485 [Deltaproteobacteria bacterium]|nr:hypothetical protein [Deltaproteobacteria bacterium]
MLLSLGRVEDNRLDDLITAISKHKEVFTLVSLAKEVSANQTFVLGPLLVLQRIFAQSGIDAILNNAYATLTITSRT